jgi:hypothetical protein
MKKFAKSISALTNLAGNSIKLDIEKSKQKSLEKDHKNFVKNYEETIEKYENEIEKLKKLNIDYENDIQYVQNELFNKNDLLTIFNYHNMDEVQWYIKKNEELQIIINDFYKKIEFQKNKLNKIAKNIIHLSNQINKDNTEEYEIKQIFIERINKEKVIIETNIEEYQNNISNLENVYKKNQNIINELQKYKINEDSERMEEYEKGYIESINTYIKSQNELIEELYKNIEEENIEFEKHIEKYEKDNKGLKDKLSGIRNKIKSNKKNI